MIARGRGRVQRPRTLAREREWIERIQREGSPLEPSVLVIYTYTLAVPILVPSYPYPNYSSYRNKSASFASYSKLYLQRWGFVKFVVTGRLDWNDFRLSSPFLLAFFP